MILNAKNLPGPENSVKSLEGLVCCNVNCKEPKGCPICNQKWKYPASSLLFHNLLGNFVFKNHSVKKKKKNHRVCMQLYLFLIVFELWPWTLNPEDDYVKRWLMCPGALEFIRPKQPCTLYNMVRVRTSFPAHCSEVSSDWEWPLTMTQELRVGWSKNIFFQRDYIYVRSSYKTRRNLIGSSGTFYISLVIAHLPWWYSKCHGRITWCPSLT